MKMLIFLVFIAHSIVLSSCYYYYGNELNQLISFLNHTEKVQNLTKWYSDCDSCSGDPLYSGIDYASTYTCAHKSHEVANISRLWYPNNSGIVNCEYEISSMDSYFMSTSEMSIAFTIYQKDCKQQVLLNGGSSFEIIIENGDGRNYCAVHDNFDNTYTVLCVIAYCTAPASSCCKSNIYITIDYEHFDAFDPAHSGHEKLLKQIAVDCPNKKHHIPYGILSKFTAAESRSLWKKYNTNSDFEYRGHGYIRLSTFLACTQSGAQIALLGDSHMRYNWNYLAELYSYNSTMLSKLNRKYQSTANDIAKLVHFPISNFELRYFHEFVKYINELPCNQTDHGMNGTDFIHVIQPGTWDLGCV